MRTQSAISKDLMKLLFAGRFKDHCSNCSGMIIPRGPSRTLILTPVASHKIKKGLVISMGGFHLHQYSRLTLVG